MVTTGRREKRYRSNPKSSGSQSLTPSLGRRVFRWISFPSPWQKLFDKWLDAYVAPSTLMQPTTLSVVFDESPGGSSHRTRLKEFTDRRFRWVLSILVVGDILVPASLFLAGWVFGIQLLEFSTAWSYIIPPIVIFNWWLIRRISSPYSVLYSYLQTIRKIDENQSNWRSTPVKRSVNRDLKGLSNNLARMPASMGGADSPQVTLSGVRRAAFVRNLQVLVCLPKDPAGRRTHNSHQEILDELGKSLGLFLEDRWEDLPEADPDSTVGVTRLQRFGLVALGLALAAGAVLLAIQSRDPNSALNAWGQVGTTMLVAAAYLAFNRAGLIPGSMQQGLDTADRFNKAFQTHDS